MKKLFLMMGLVLGALTLTNCTNDIDENIAPEGATKEFALTVAAGDQTRTTIDDFTTSWAAGDQINLFYAPAGTTDYVNAGAFTITEENLAENKFTGTVPADFDTTAAYDWYAIYPYNESLASPNNSDISMTIGASEQTQVGDNNTAHLCGTTVPLVGRVSSTNAPAITMNHLASIIEVSVYNKSESDFKVHRIDLQAEHPIKGAFVVNFASDEIVYSDTEIPHYSYSTGYANSIRLRVNDNGYIAPNASAKYYIAVKPFEAAAGEVLKFVVETNKGDVYITKTISQELNFEAGKVRKIGLNTNGDFNLPFGEGTQAFLQAIVDGQMLGESTPTDVNGSFSGIAIRLVDGKREIINIDGAGFVDLPTVMNLPELNYMNISGKRATLEGKKLPATWNTPKLQYLNIANCGLTGALPEGLGSTTAILHTIFMNDNDFSGAWPHFWASGVNGGTGKLECVIAIPGNTGMGYMVPATLDVKLNNWKNDDQSQGHANISRDKTQMKLGGADVSGNYIGFEEGWGQERYVTYGGGVAADKSTWHATRPLSGTPSIWPYFTNLPGAIPTAMYAWDQAAADAYTADGTLPEITVTVGEGTKAFLQEIIDGQMLGNSTPTVSDWNNLPTFSGITIAQFNNKLEITRIAAGSFTKLPSTFNLPQLTYFHAQENANFNGQTFPTTWNTPKLQYVNIAVCGFVGEFPESFAENTPSLHTIFMNKNNFVGAWPHTWAAGVNGGTGKLECFIANDGNESMGYMVPATLDVKLNVWKDSSDHLLGHANPSGDLTQIKLGGAGVAGNYSGFEKGWGQERYVTFAGGAADDKTTWHVKRGLAGNPDEWAYYFTNIPGAIPQVMLDWDQAAADAYTASKL